MPDPRIYAVAGNPVLHSLSPEIYRAGFDAVGFSGLATRLAARTAAEIFIMAERLGLAGLNITSPFKESVLPFLAALDPAARALGAANTLVRRNGGWHGYNTDPDGVIGALQASGKRPRGRRAVVLGAGGAGRAAAYGLSRAGALVTIVNRTAERAEGAARDIGCGRASWERRGECVRDAEIVVSCLSARERTIEPECLHGGQAVLDARYPDSSLAEDAAGRGCAVIPAKEWLLHQALPAFGHFTGLPAPVAAMREGLNRAASPLSKPGLALIGFMGAGKSSVANEIARRTGRRFIDTDARIELQAGISVSGYFARFGEPAFRRRESRMLRNLKFDRDRVVALGGGSVLDPDNGERVRRKAVTFWICSDPGRTARRISDGSRPLLPAEKSAEAAEALFRERIGAYARAADAVVLNDDGDGGPEAAAERIIDEIRRALDD